MRFTASASILCGVLAIGLARAQEPATGVPELQPIAPLPAGQLVFSFAPMVPGQAAWEITVDPDRKGSYRERLLGSASQPLQVSEGLWKRLQAGTKIVESGNCETKLKSIAKTGEKNLSLVVGTSLTSCKFNYSDDAALNDTASAFIALAETIQEGAKLQHDHRFDKLALDADMEVLVSEMAAGRALEAENIGPVLLSLVEDERVMDRVRRKAARLLQDAGVDVPALPDKAR